MTGQNPTSFYVNGDQTSYEIHPNKLYAGHTGEFIVTKKDAEKLLSVSLDVDRIIKSYKNGGNNLSNYLYTVTVVDQDGKILLDKKVVAKDDESAKFKAGVYRELEFEALTPEDVTIVTIRGSVVKVKDKESKEKGIIISDESLQKIGQLLGNQN